MPGKQTQHGDASRAYSLGIELVCAVAGFVLVGVWIDRHYRSGPWGTLICLFLGLIGGFYNLFRESSRLFGGPFPRRADGVRGDSGAPGMERDTARASGAARAERQAPGPQPDKESEGKSGPADPAQTG